MCAEGGEAREMNGIVKEKPNKETQRSVILGY